MGAVIIERLPTLADAQIVRALLNESGIEAWIQNEEHAAVDSLLIPAMNGVAVMVLQNDLAAAKEILEASRLKEGEYESADPDGTAGRKRRNRGRIVFYGVFILPIVVVLIFIRMDAAKRERELLDNYSYGVNRR